ncbi:MAG: RNA polymerase recycling motor ATPase HelR [Ornithinibacter sp.]
MTPSTEPDAATTTRGHEDEGVPGVRVFALPAHLAAKADPALIADDERHFASIARSLERAITDLTGRLDGARRAPAGAGQGALDRDLEVHRLTARLHTLRRYGLDLCLGHVVPANGGDPVYVGRLGLTDADGERLLVDWRSPVAEPFFGATHADPMGLASRRRYRWTRGRVSDYWDEVFTPDGLRGHAASLDDQSAFIASLGATRSPRMRDVLGTIAADQDAIVRAGSKGALVVDGGPGTGKTVVALHRTAYLLYSDPRLGHRRGGVLFVGPHQPYLSYVSDVLPSLGEEGVQTCTLRDLVPEGAAARDEADPAVARLKADARLVAAIEPAVRLYEEPPTHGMEVSTPLGDVWVGTADWADAFDAPAPGAAHNESRDVVWEALLGILVDKLRAEADDGADAGWPDDDAGQGEDFDAYGITATDPSERFRRALSADRNLAQAFARAWPLIEPTDLVGDLWSVPAYLRRCAPWLERDEIFALQREDPTAWTTADLPLLDAARRRLGDPEAPARRARREAADAAERDRMADVVTDLIASDDSELHVMSMLRGQDLRTALVDEDAVPRAEADPLAGPFAHVVVDEAQELTDAEWQMVLARCPSRSLTIVGDRAQARHGFPESWQERLQRAGLRQVDVASLNVNYRTPSAVMAEAEPVIRAAVPDANVPTSVRDNGVPVLHGAASEAAGVVDGWLATHDEGVACVIGDPTFVTGPRVRSLTPQLAKGLEFDLVVLVDPHRFGGGIEGAVDRYVAMTRATQQLVILTSS